MCAKRVQDERACARFYVERSRMNHVVRATETERNDSRCAADDNIIMVYGRVEAGEKQTKNVRQECPFNPRRERVSR